MAGIYIHIPFCRQACHYCDFYFTIDQSYKEKMLSALVREIELRKNYLKRSELETIYFGGGTPSVLTIEHIHLLLNAIHKNHPVSSDPEITMETNPDDVNNEYLVNLGNLGINRLSIGVQSFFDEDLKLLNRIHSSREAEACIKTSQDAGFDNINTDIIYGIPGLTLLKWEKNLARVIEMNVPHISAYHLAYEYGTVLDFKRRKGKITVLTEDQSLDQFRELVRSMKKNNYLHYEISNFAKPGFFSKHNSNYWKNGQYIGIGPSAYSYNTQTRQWNIPRNASYMRGINEGEGYYREEFLTAEDRYHDYLLTSLRTMWGTDLEYIRTEIGERFYNHCLKYSAKFIDSRDIRGKENRLILTDKGMFRADYIIRELFLE